MTFEDFQKTYGAEWYKLVNTPMWRAMRQVFDRNGVARKLTALPPEQIATLGAVYAANIQGQMDVLQAMEEQLIVADAVAKAPEETYEGPEFSTGNPPPRKRKGRK